MARGASNFPFKTTVIVFHGRSITLLGTKASKPTELKVADMGSKNSGRVLLGVRMRKAISTSNP